MEFESIGKFFGAAKSSQNNEFILIDSNEGSNKPSTLLVATKESKELIYSYKLKYAASTAISNQGHSAAISFNYKNMDAVISCIDPNGDLSFVKKSHSVPNCLAFDNECKFLVIAFAGEEQYVECYSIVWIDIKSGMLIKAEQAPNLLPIFELEFDDQNSLIIGN